MSPGMPDYRGWRRKSQDDPELPAAEGTSWIDRGPLAYEEGDQEYEQIPRRYSTGDHRYHHDDHRQPDPDASGHPPFRHSEPPGQPAYTPPRDPGTGHPSYPRPTQDSAGHTSYPDRPGNPGEQDHPGYPGSGRSRSGVRDGHGYPPDVRGHQEDGYGHPAGRSGYQEEPTDHLPSAHGAPGYHDSGRRGYYQDEPTVQTYHSAGGAAPRYDSPSPEAPTGHPRYDDAADEPTGQLPYAAPAAGGYPPKDEPTAQVPYPQTTNGHPGGGPPQRSYPPPEPPRQPPSTDADATVVMPSLRNAPQAPPTPIPQLQFNAADTTMLMSAVPYFAPSATPAYTGTIYVSYAASRAQMEDEAAARPEAEREGAAASVARSGAIMALGSIVSRLLGMVRVVVLGAVLGTAIGNTYTTANTIPSMMYELLLGGILTSVLVPLLVRAREHDPDRGQAFTQRLLSLAVLTLGAATVLAVVAAPLLTAIMAGENHGAAERSLMTSLAYLLLPEVFFFGIAGVLAAVLNTRGHFAAPMWTPILNNIVVIGAAGVYWLVSDQVTLNPADMTYAQILVLGVGTTLGIAAQALGLIPALRKVGFRWRWRFDFRNLHLAELGRVAGWMACYVAVSQIGVLVIIKLAYAAGSAPLVDGGKAAGPWIYNNAFLLFMMAHGIVGVSIITALMPRMSAAAADHEHHEVARNISLGIRLTSVVLIPVTAAYLVLGGAIASVLFVWGKYTAADSEATGLVVAVAGIGLVPFAISQIQTFAFYALTETRTAALINIPVVATKVIVDVALFYTLDARYVAAGLMVGNLLSYTLGAVISARMLRARLGPMGQGAVFRTLGRLAIAGLVGALACAGALQLLNGVLGTGKVYDAVRIVVGGTVLLVVYFAAAWAMRVREINDVAEMLNRKLGGRLPVGKRPKSGADNQRSAPDLAADRVPAAKRGQGEGRRPPRDAYDEPRYGARQDETRYGPSPQGHLVSPDERYSDELPNHYGEPRGPRPGPRSGGRPRADRGQLPPGVQEGDSGSGRRRRGQQPPYPDEPPYRDGRPYR